jgi:hypothetical protein
MCGPVYLILEGTVNNFLKVLIPLLFLVLLAACAAQLSEPTPTETPQLPEKAEIVAAFFRAVRENQEEEALSYLAEDVRLPYGDFCLSGKYARVAFADGNLRGSKREWIGENYRVDGDIVHVDYKTISSDGIIGEEGSLAYSVSDGLIQWEGNCGP